MDVHSIGLCLSPLEANSLTELGKIANNSRRDQPCELFLSPGKEWKVWLQVNGAWMDL